MRQNDRYIIINTLDTNKIKKKKEIGCNFKNCSRISFCITQKKPTSKNPFWVGLFVHGNILPGIQILDRNQYWSQDFMLMSSMLIAQNALMNAVASLALVMRGMLKSMAARRILYPLFISCEL